MGWKIFSDTLPCGCVESYQDHNTWCKIENLPIDSSKCTIGKKGHEEEDRLRMLAEIEAEKKSRKEWEQSQRKHEAEKQRLLTLKKTELVSICKVLGITKGGNKKELQDRLQNNFGRIYFQKVQTLDADRENETAAKSLE